MARLGHARFDPPSRADRLPDAFEVTYVLSSLTCFSTSGGYFPRSCAATAAATRARWLCFCRLFPGPGAPAFLGH